MDRISLITKERLNTKESIHDMICDLGFNTEKLHEQPEIVRANGGGLLIWQYPNQFSEYLFFLKDFKISSYIEIGCRWGGTYILTTEFLKKMGTVEKSVAVDIIDSPVTEYCNVNSECRFLKINSKSDDFKTFMKENSFDLIFIDGDHSYNGVKNDFETSKDSGNMFVFHDISSCACPGVVNFWKEMKSNPEFDCYEFTEQYPDVPENYLGIGVAIRRK
jgi:cephalosporin hydroxylase